MKLTRRTLIKASAAGAAVVGLGAMPELTTLASGQPTLPGWEADIPPAAPPPPDGPIPGKDATAMTAKANAEVLEMLDFANEHQIAGIDSFADAARGFIATRPDLVVTAEDGREVWNLPNYAFLGQEEAPPSVNPSLWRQARLNMFNGLFEVVEGVYQVRGFDLSNMTIVEGPDGLVIIDPLISAEVARAALDLYYEHRPQKPVAAVIYTHSHVDHFGGVRGVVSDADIAERGVAIVAPDGFLEAAVSENVMAGAAMNRRADYMYAPLLPRGEKGQVDAGLGKTRSDGAVSFIAPNDVIMATGETRTIGGVEMEFQLAPGTEAPAEMTVYFPQYRVFDSAELACDTLHNILTLRGAQVRDASAWAYYLNEAIALYGDRTDVVISQHHWPKWGQEQVVAFLKAQRDMYKYMHDQTLRLMNHGYTGIEIAEMLQRPESLNQQWFLRDYYGTLNHNVKAIYQRYLGWFDANPANLHPLPPEESAKKYISYMGSLNAVMSRARKDFRNGDYRWVAEVMNKVVFAYPDNDEARNLQADALEQLGYQAESAVWRNFYLMGAYELRNGVLSRPGGGSHDTVGAMTIPMIFDYLGVRLIAPDAEGKRIVIVWNFRNPDGQYVLNLENAALTYIECPPGVPPADADTTVTLERRTLNAILGGVLTLQQAIASGASTFTGNPAKIGELFGMLDTFGEAFNIVTP
ncbi:MAG TPA: alkyl sulfatase dimerization domain-containing protein [Thermomicrobiales bacterium]|nr:alkyl sulfatase dimerization domain-containing protein [Thermomicrobiales bacterium]